MNQKNVKKSNLADLTPEQDALFTHFQGLNIQSETWDHPPVFTVGESEYIYEVLPRGAHCKSLFLTDHNGLYVLAVAHDSTRADLKNLAKRLNCKRFSFVSPETMADKLCVTPGSVTPFALINDSPASIRVLVDSAIMPFETVYFHPLKNDKTTGISRDDFFRFLEHSGHTPEIVNLASPLENNS